MVRRLFEENTHTKRKRKLISMIFFVLYSLKSVLNENPFQKQQNSLIAGLRATNEALLKQEIMNNAAQDITSGGTSNGSMDKKETSPECLDPLQIEHIKEQATPSTGNKQFLMFFLK